MAKKNLKSGIESILSSTEIPVASQATSKQKTRKSTSKKKVSLNENLRVAMDPTSPSSHVTHVAPDKLMGKIRFISSVSGTSVKNVLNQSLAHMIIKWEEKNHPISDSMLILKRKKEQTII